MDFRETGNIPREGVDVTNHRGDKGRPSRPVTMLARAARTYLYVLPVRSKLYLASVRHRPPWLLPAVPYLAVFIRRLTAGTVGTRREK